MPHQHDIDGEPTSPSTLSPEAREAMLFAAVLELVQRARAEEKQHGYLRSLAESEIPVLRLRLDQFAVLLGASVACASAGYSMRDLLVGWLVSP